MLLESMCIIHKICGLGSKMKLSMSTIQKMCELGNKLKLYRTMVLLNNSSEISNL